MRGFQKMGTKREHNTDQKKQIKKHISAKLALSGACLILSTSATISHATEIENDVATETEIAERLRAIKTSSQTQGNAESSEINQESAWTNWDDWTKK